MNIFQTMSATVSNALGVTTVANNAATNGGSQANTIAAPAMFTGGNLVNSVNASYQTNWAQLQANYATASDAYNQAIAQIARKQQDVIDLQKQWDNWDSQVTLWMSRHRGCGPGWAGYDYSCGECDNEVSKNTTNREGVGAQMNSSRSDIANIQQQISQYLKPQLDFAANELNNSYANYKRDAQAAADQEAKAAASQAATALQNKQTELQSDPTYVASQNAAKIAAQNAEIAKQKEANNQKFRTYALIGGVLVAIIALAVVGYKVIKR